MKLLAFAIFTFFILVVFFLAYLNLIPTKIDEIPHYDTIGHFTLYGIWGYLFALVLIRPAISILKLKLPIGILTVSLIAIAEECLQSLSVNRSFSILDITWGMLGIVTALLVINFNSRRKSLKKN